MRMLRGSGGTVVVMVMRAGPAVRARIVTVSRTSSKVFFIASSSRPIIGSPLALSDLRNRRAAKQNSDGRSCKA